MKRREFIHTGTGAAIAGAWSHTLLPQVAHERDVSYEPNRPLESTGLSIRDGNKILKKGEKKNTAPALREEILDNPDAVFIIHADIKAERDEKGNWKPCPDQIERFGNRVADLVFRKGAVRGGRTFIKPNLVGGLSKSNPVGYSHSGIVHPCFIVGMTDELHGMGNTNVAIGARGALRHNQVVESGFQELLDAHNLPLIEALPAPYVSMVEGIFARGCNEAVNANFVTVGRSMAAVDSVTSWLMGHDPRELPYLRIANERGLGQNDMDKIPIYTLSEKGVEKVKDYRFMQRHHLGIYNYGLNELGPRFF